MADFDWILGCLGRGEGGEYFPVDQVVADGRKGRVRNLKFFFGSWGWSKAMQKKGYKRWPRLQWKRDPFVNAILSRIPHENIGRRLSRHWYHGGGKNVHAGMRWWWGGWALENPSHSPPEAAWAHFLGWLRSRQEQVPTVENVAVALSEGYHEAWLDPRPMDGWNSLLTEGALLGALWIMTNVRDNLREFLRELQDSIPTSATSTKDVLGLQAECFTNCMEIGRDPEVGEGARIAALETARRLALDMHKTAMSSVPSEDTSTNIQRLKARGQKVVDGAKGGTGNFGPASRLRQLPPAEEA